MGAVVLRRVDVGDIDEFFGHHADPKAIRMAAFTSANPADRPRFRARWRLLLGDPEVVARTITVEDDVVGSIMVHRGDHGSEITYWIDRPRWGQGIASKALTALLDEVSERPLFARVATDNIGSLTVLERCGFTRESTHRSFAAGRGSEIDEYLMALAD